MSERKPRRVLGYARVSSREQGTHGTSLEAQQEELARYCASRGYPKPQLFVEVESGSGAKAEKRAEQLKLMAMLRPGDLVLVAKQDRWSRDVIHYLSSADTIHRLGASLTSIAEGLNVDNPEQRFAATSFASFSEYERRRIAERTQTARARLRAMGFHVDGHAPFGYRVQARRLVIVPERAEQVREMFAACIAGDTTRKLAERFETDHAAITRRLRDRRYLGEVPATPFRINGKDLPTTWLASHEPIVDRASFDAVQRALTRRRMMERTPGADSRNAGFLLRSLARCAHCDHVLLAHHVTPGDSVTHAGWYSCRYRPKCDGPRARQDAVDARAEELMLARLGELVEQLAKPPRVAKAAPRFDEEKAALERKRERLVDAVAEGTLSANDVRKRMADNDQALADLEERRAQWEAEQRRARPEVRAEQLRDVKRLARAWSRIGPEERREIIRMHAERVEIRSTQKRLWQRGAWELSVVWKR